jgi:hypothetical protein
MVAVESFDVVDDVERPDAASKVGLSKLDI